MEILNYKISYEYGSDLYTVTQKQIMGKLLLIHFQKIVL